MNAFEKLKIFIECHENFNPKENYGLNLVSSVSDLSGFPKVEIGGDASEEIRFTTSNNYNEEKYELLELEHFEIISANEDEIIVCAGAEHQAPLTFTIKEDMKGGLQIIDVHHAFNEGMSYEEFDDLIRNI